jgi:hypothetical protein
VLRDGGGGRDDRLGIVAVTAKSRMPYVIYPILRVDDLIRSFLGAVSFTATAYFAHKVVPRPDPFAAIFGATFAGGIVLHVALRGWVLLRDSSDRRFIERQQREIREEAAARAAAEINRPA